MFLRLLILFAAFLVLRRVLGWLLSGPKNFRRRRADKQVDQEAEQKELSDQRIEEADYEELP